MDATKIDMIFMATLLERREFAAVRLKAIDLSNNIGECCGVARLEEEEAHFMILPRRRGLISDDNRIAEDLVAQKGQVELQMLLEMIFEELEIADFLAIENSLNESVFFQLRQPCGIPQAVDVAAKVVDYEAQTQFVRHAL